ncbi:MAG: aromatic ring-hydroxylating oxygenase subunit alpha [Methylophilaceae bacterium]
MSTLQTATIQLHSNPMAPLPMDALSECLKPFGESRMLPRAAYVDNAVLNWERKHLFEAGWVCAGRTSIVSEPNSQAAIQVGDRGVLVTRDDKNQLHAFENICRHRGHELLACGKKTNQEKIVCPYHAWCYDSDGSFFNAREMDDIKNAIPSELGLIPIRSAEWGGWLFLNYSGGAAPFSEYIGSLDAMIKDWDCERLVVGASHDYELQANWKVAIENYHECYHCGMIHPALCEVSPPDTGGLYSGENGLFTGGWMILADHAETMSFDGKSTVSPFPKLTETQRREVHYITLFPNFLISLHPDFVMTHRLEPVAPGKTKVECQWLFAPEAAERADFDPSFAVNFWDTTNKEDWGAVESVQRGLASEKFIPGILSAEEESVYQFVHLVASAYMQKPIIKSHRF